MGSILNQWKKNLTASFSAKRYLQVFGIATGVFLLYHILIWTVLTSKVFNATPYYIGDLGRMSYQIDSLFPRLTSNHLPRKHFDGTNWHNQPIDLITIGDSFSNGGGGGKNPYYQDYLATQYYINVLNIQNIDDTFGYIDTIRYLHKNKWFEKVRPKAILIESVERATMDQVTSKKNLISVPPDKINEYLFKKSFTDAFPSTLLINTANYKAPYYYIRYHFSDHAKKEIYKLSLTKNFFTVQDQNHLLVYDDDLKKNQQFYRKKHQESKQ